MQETVITGRIMKGSNAEIKVQLIPNCNPFVITPSTEIKLVFYTLGDNSVAKEGDDIVVSGDFATVLLSKDELDILPDGVLRYQSFIDDEVFEMETRWFIKTPADYTPNTYPSVEDVKEIASEIADEKIKEIGAVTEEMVDEKIDEALNDYYTKQEVDDMIPEVNNFATKDELQEVENKIPSIAGLATEEYVNNKITEVEGKIPSVEGLASEAYVDGKVSDINAVLEDKADKTEIPDVSGKVDNVNGVSGIWQGTKAQYDALASHSNNIVYIIKG